MNGLTEIRDANVEAGMATAEYIFDAPGKMRHYLRLMAEAQGTSAIVEAVQGYLADWPKESVASVQKIDAGWAPFDAHQRPLQVSGALDVRCIRDAVHCHCMALRESGMAQTPELLELDEFFFVASELVEKTEARPKY